MNRIIQYILYCDFVTGIMVSGFIQVVAYKYFLPFYGQIHCMNMPHFAYSFHPLIDV